MNHDNVTLSKLALAATMYDSLTPFNRSLARLNEATAGKIDLTDSSHRMALLKWLNDWGCRNLAKDQHKVASKSILDWQQKYGAGLFSDRNPLWNLKDNELESAAHAYGLLKDMSGAERIRNGKKQMVSIGETAASKILFAVRPEALMPWDEAMRKRFKCNGSPESYYDYLKIIQGSTCHIADLCKAKGFKIEDLPKKLDRPDATVLALVNEYIWVTVTRERELPSSEMLARWVELG